MTLNLSQVLYDWSEVFMQHSFSYFKHFMDQWSLSPSQVSTLFLLRQCQSCGVSDIGQHLGVTNAAASQLVERLVQQAFIIRMEDPDDRRYKLIKLTSQGQKLLDDGIQARQQWMEQLSATIPQKQQEIIIQALILLTESARNFAPGIHIVSADTAKQK